MSDERRAIGPAAASGPPRLPGRAPADDDGPQSPGESTAPLPADADKDTPRQEPGTSEDHVNNDGRAQGAWTVTDRQYGSSATEDRQEHAVTEDRRQGSAAADYRGAEQAYERAPQYALPAGMAADEVKIGLWGSPSSGKTTFLGALRHAVQTDKAMGEWTIIPGNQSSSELLVSLTHTLVRLQEFPVATPLGAEVELQWHFIGDLVGSEVGRRRPRKWSRRGPADSKFLLNLIDVSGEAFSHTPESRNVPVNVVNRALGHLAASQGLIYLFDPIVEQELRHSVEYVNNTIVNLSARMLAEGRLIGKYVPQHLSVCITKFDHPEFFQQARWKRLVNSGPDGMPRVLDKDARTLFNMICDGKFWEYRDEQSLGSAQFIRDELTNRFHPDRIRYFVTSSIGFHRPLGWDPVAGLGPEFKIDPENFANVHEVDGKLRIRGPIAPINVLEPLISLQQRLTGGAGSRG